MFDFVMIAAGSTLFVNVYKKASAASNVMRKINVLSLLSSDKGKKEEVRVPSASFSLLPKFQLVNLTSSCLALIAPPLPAQHRIKTPASAS